MADAEEVQLPRVLQLLWDRAEPGRRGPKPGLTIRDIGSAAARVADAEGLTAVSMSRVAAEFGLTTMALYRYVDSKDELHTAMLDTAYGHPPVRANSRAGWRTRLEAWCRANRAQLLRHPWIVQIAVTGPPLTPNALRWMEAGMQALAATGLSEQEKLSCMLLADVYVRGHVQLATSMARAQQESALTQREADSRYIQRLARLVDAETYPAVHTAMLSGSLQDEGDFAEEDFAFGLNTVLDGIAARVQRATRRTQRTAT